MSWLDRSLLNHSIVTILRDPLDVCGATRVQDAASRGVNDLDIVGAFDGSILNDFDRRCDHVGSHFHASTPKVCERKNSRLAVLYENSEASHRYPLLYIGKSPTRIFRDISLSMYL